MAPKKKAKKSPKKKAKKSPKKKAKKSPKKKAKKSPKKKAKKSPKKKAKKSPKKKAKKSPKKKAKKSPKKKAKKSPKKKAKKSPKKKAKKSPKKKAKKSPKKKAKKSPKKKAKKSPKKKAKKSPKKKAKKSPKKKAKKSPKKKAKKSPKKKAKKSPKKKAKKSPAKKAVQRSLALPVPAELQPDVGDPAPAFDLISDDGSRVRNTDFAGRRFVIYFYPRDNTPGCTKQACEFTAESAFAAAGIPVVGVSRDSSESHQRFRTKYELGIVLLTDHDSAVAAKYGAWGEKKLYGRTSLGTIRSTFVVGPDGTLEAVYRPVRKASGNAARVKLDLGL